MAAGLAVAAAALAVCAPRAPQRTETHVDAVGAAERARQRPPSHAGEVVSAPVRIADAATVRLLRRGDLVDVIAAADSRTGGDAAAARVVASGARVSDVPSQGQASPDDGALVVLSVPRATAAQLAGAGATSRLAVTLC